MRLSHDKTEDLVCIKIAGELGHHEARETLKYIEGVLDLYSISTLEIDFSDLAFMDSSGIAVIMQTYKNVKSLGAILRISGMPTQAKKVLHAAGIDKIVEIN